MHLTNSDAAGLWSDVGTSRLGGRDLVQPRLRIYLALEGAGVLTALVVDITCQPSAPLALANGRAAVRPAPPILDTGAAVASLHAFPILRALNAAPTGSRRKALIGINFCVIFRLVVDRTESHQQADIRTEKV
ncbi:hypothetical protein [Mycolicibacterium peregrinum]|uniref:hypothetical protein n=1 Tax=Mycolicibacterium peregrinum TaxID=43304 RepID=UPI0006D7CEEB|nr:hypothetical protein [Mycolicibacterium peregrinum]